MAFSTVISDNIIMLKNSIQPIDAPSTQPSSRRSFLFKLWIAAGVAALAECLAVAAAFLMPRKKKAKAGDFGTVIEVGPVQNFAYDSVTAFVRSQFYLARLKDGGFLALSCKCTHLGCTLPWVSEKKQFVCPCHASAFDISGEVSRPPASRALDIYPVFIENNVIKVDTGQRIRRSQFRAKHLVYAGDK
jgi:cytochrome b6-f complex iron-sulfur subunit